MSLKKIMGNIIAKVVNTVSGNGLSQNELEATGALYETPNLREKIREVAGECVVLLQNNGVLPMSKDRNLAVFGRCQYDSFYVGYGSGGDVHTTKNISVIEGLTNSDALSINQELSNIYKHWCDSKEHMADHGYWGHWPYCYDEMPLNSDIISIAKHNSDTALVVLGRAAGEDRENKLEEGIYYLTATEKEMIRLVTDSFSDVIILFNCGNIIDTNWINDYPHISAVLYAWQLGEELGNAIADVISGKVNPCAKLPDTIAREYNDYPSSSNFGGLEYNNYAEDIFVGYRYFETFAKDKVLFPFGYGLSYTDFEITTTKCEQSANTLDITCSVKNIGNKCGKEVVQVYVAPPNDILKQATRNLVAFHKTKSLEPNESEIITFSIKDKDYASYDDAGASGNKSCYVKLKGTYEFLIGNSVRNTHTAYTMQVDNTEIIEQLSAVCVPNSTFQTLAETDVCKADTKIQVTKARILANLPKELPHCKNNNINFRAVVDQKANLDDFIAQLSDRELQALTRGEGAMNSKLGVPGNAGAFGGIIPSLRTKGVPPIITCDGPAGIRIKAYAGLLPCGTALASSWNTSIVEELFCLLGKEMLHYGVDIILSPGMNIHRNPLCGRNFEYFAEDPVLSGKTASAVVRGVQSMGVGACPKHFACNNQETKRNTNDSRVSERALREIYLKGFEICVKESKPMSIMTSYNKINGVWSHYNYELVTTVLRDEWQFDGVVVTDWWMRRSASPEFPQLNDNAYRVRGQIDVLMPGNMGYVSKKYRPDRSLLATLGKPDGITRAELQRTAKTVLNCAIAKLKRCDK